MLERTRTQSPFYTPDHEAFRDVMRRFVAREIEPYAHEWDEAGEFPRALYVKAAEIGLLGLGFPEEYGGVAADQFMKIVASQELARAGAGGVSASLMSHTIGSPPIARAARPEIKARVLPEVLSGKKISALAITEPSGGSDVANLRTKARRDGDHYVVSGEKTFITSGMRADYLTVAVRTGGEGAGGVSLLLIEGDTPGLSRTKLKKMGWWASDTATLHFDECRVPVVNLIGEEGHGFQDHHAEFQQRTHGHGGELHRLCPRLRRGRDRLCQGAQDFRQADRAAPGHPPQDRRHDAEGRGDAGDAGDAGVAARAGREPGRRDLHAEEPGHANHGVLRLRSGADLRRRRLHARHQGRAHLPRGQGQCDRRRHRGDHEGSRQPADGACDGQPAVRSGIAPSPASGRRKREIRTTDRDCPDAQLRI